jgi:hypothetical protein
MASHQRRLSPSEKRIRSLILLAYCLLGLSGCFFGDDDAPGYPPLAKEALAGCWFEPGQAEDCRETCFDADSNFYYLGLDSNVISSEVGVLEWLGTFKVEGRNTLSLSFNIRQQSADGAPEDKATSELALSRTVEDDTVYSVGEGGKYAYMSKSDPTHNCGLRWRLFSKPGNWSSN